MWMRPAIHPVLLLENLPERGTCWRSVVHSIGKVLIYIIIIIIKCLNIIKYLFIY